MLDKICYQKNFAHSALPLGHIHAKATRIPIESRAYDAMEVDTGMSMNSL